MSDIYTWRYTEEEVIIPINGPYDWKNATRVCKVCDVETNEESCWLCGGLTRGKHWHDAHDDTNSNAIYGECG